MRLQHSLRSVSEVAANWLRFVAAKIAVWLGLRTLYSILVRNCNTRSSNAAGTGVSSNSRKQSAQKQQQQVMAQAEAHNAAGNDAFNAGDYSKASDLYFKAVKANGNVAKYRTNLCNALLKCGRPALAVEEAAAAIAVDATWPKGYYYKALALEEIGEVARALAACEEGLHIHKHEPSLEALHTRLQKRKRGLDRQQQRQAAGQTEMRKVIYCATVHDAAGHEKAFKFEHQIDSRRLAKAATDNAEATRIIQEVAMPHYNEMLRAKPWVCVSCQLQHERRTPATKLFLHPMSYLTKPEPRIQDMGPTPACGSQACATYSTQMAQQMMAELMREMGR